MFLFQNKYPHYLCIIITWLKDKIIQMQCQSHPARKITHKCLTCLKYICSECSKLHHLKNHQLLTSIELCENIKLKISEQLNKMTLKLMQLQTLRDYELGENVIVGCMQEIVEFVRKLFVGIREEFRKIADQSWRQENIWSIQQIQQKRNTLQEWSETIIKKPDQAPLFDVQKIYENNKLDSDQQLIDSSQSYILSNASPKIVFNQIALRRVNQSLSKIIYTQTKFRVSIGKKFNPNNVKKLGSLNGGGYASLCRFVEGANVLFEYVVQDGDTEDVLPKLERVEFREFVVPMRSVCVTVGAGVYLIGGYNKENKPKKEILYYQRAYASMRVVGLLRQGRVGHAVCSYQQNIYIFGGKMTKSLQVFNTKTKKSQILAETKYEILGSSMTVLSGKLYILGGTDGVQTSKHIFCFDIPAKKLIQLAPSNISLYSMPISPILQPLSQNQILIMGGYFTYAGQSYNNSYMMIFDNRLNYLAVYGKGELIYPILSNGCCSVLRENKIICLADLKRLRHKHGPNMPVIFTYSLNDQAMQLDCIGL